MARIAEPYVLIYADPEGQTHITVSHSSHPTEQLGDMIGQAILDLAHARSLTDREFTNERDWLTIAVIARTHPELYNELVAHCLSVIEERENRTEPPGDGTGA